MRAEKTIAIKSALISLKALENGKLALMDKNGTFRQIELQDYKTVDGYKSNIAHEHSWGNHLSISASGKYVASTIPHTNKTILYSVESKKALHTITRDKGDTVNASMVLVGADDHIEEFCENIFEYTGHYVDLFKFQKGDIMLFRPSSIISDIRKTR